MNPTVLLLSVAIVGAAYAYSRYLEAKEKERAASQWSSVLGLGKTLLGM